MILSLVLSLWKTSRSERTSQSYWPTANSTTLYISVPTGPYKSTALTRIAITQNIHVAKWALIQLVRWLKPVRCCYYPTAVMQLLGHLRRGWWALLSLCILSAYMGKRIISLISFNNMSTVMLSLILRITCFRLRRHDYVSMQVWKWFRASPMAI